MSVLKYIGIPYKINGETFENSDCYGLCKLFAKNELNITLPTYFYSDIDNEQTAEIAIQLAKHGMGEGWQKVDSPEYGDIVTFRIMGHEVHCGIMISSKEFLHSLKGRMSCIEELSHINWQHRLTGVYRWTK